MSTDQIGPAMVGARAALDTLSELLTEWSDEKGFPVDVPCLSMNDVLRLIAIARTSIEETA